MKRAIKVLLAILLATVMVVAVAACTPTEKDPCANGHSWDDGQKVTADCTQPGKLVRHCKVCGASWETDLAAGEHTWGEYKVTKAPTCTEDGTETRTCLVCGKTEDQTITSDGHVWGEYKVTKAPTCTEDGLETRTCSVCGETDQKTLPAAHSWGEVTVTKAPTCKQPGIGSAQCTVCGEHSDSIEIPATGIHSWNDGSVTKAPDCETAGVLTYTCTVCGDTTTQSLPANGHAYGRLIPQADATCTENGTKAHYQCSVCGKLFDEFKTSVSASDLVIRSTGHSLSERLAKAATCTEEGYEAYYQCRRCNKLFADDDASQPIDAPVATPKADHTPQPYGAKAATCTQQGATAGSKCAVCGKILTTPKATPALGHEFYYVEHDEQETHTERCRRCDHSVEQACIPDTQWAANDDYHWHTCLLCDGEVDRAVHSTESGSKQCTICGREIGEVVVRVDGADDKICTSVKTAIEYISETYPNGDVTATIVINADRDGDGVTIEGNIHVVIDLSNLVYKISKGTTIVGGQADVTFTNGTVDGKITYKGGTLRFSEVDSTKLIIDMNGATCDDAEIYFDGVLRTHSAVEGWQVDETARKHYHVCAYCSARIDEAACVTENKYDNSDHWSECTTCHEKYDLAGHTMAYQNTAPGTHKHYCKECGYVDESDTACTPDSGDTNHDQTHGLDGGWYADADFHWRKCAKCGEEYGKEAHQFDKKESDGLCKDCGHKFFDVKISDDNGLDQSVPTIAEAFAWIETNGVAGRTYTVTLTHNRSDASEATVTVPAGYTIVLDLAGHTVTYTNGNLSIEDGSLEIKGDENSFKVKAIVYGGGTLKLPAGEYKFEFDNGKNCSNAQITIDGKAIAHNWNVTQWNWANSYSGTGLPTVTVDIECAICSETHQVTATAKQESRTNSNCEVQGSVQFSATATYDGASFATEENKQYTLALAAHQYTSGKYAHIEGTWQHQQVCDVCGKPTGKKSDCSSFAYDSGFESNYCTTCNGKYAQTDILDAIKSGKLKPTSTDKFFFKGIVYDKKTGGGTTPWYNIWFYVDNNKEYSFEAYAVSLNGKVAYDNIYNGAEVIVSGTGDDLMYDLEHAHGFEFYETNGKNICKVESYTNKPYTVSTSDNHQEISGSKLEITLTDGEGNAIDTNKTYNTGTLVKVKVTVSGAKIVSVTVGDKELSYDADEGVYAFYVEGPSEIIVTIGGINVPSEQNEYTWKASDNPETVDGTKWEESGHYLSANLGGIAEATVEHGKTSTYTGAYNSKTNWRLYQSENNTLTIKPKAGYAILSVTIYYESNDSGELYYGEGLAYHMEHMTNNNREGTLYTLSGEEQTKGVTFTVKSTSSSKTSGKVFIFQIDITYKYTTNHQFGELIPGSAPSCETPGVVAHYECSNPDHAACRGKYFDEEGNVIESVEIPAKGQHGLVNGFETIPQQDATCTEEGHVAYYKCKDCGQLFSDAQHSVKIESVDQVEKIPALGHLFEKDTYQKDSTGHWQECTRANCDAEKGKRFNESDHDKGLYHSDDTYHWRYCETCGWEEEHTSLGNDNKHNTNGEAGACDVCGYGAKNFTIEGVDSYDDFAEVVKALQTISSDVTVKVNKALDGDITYTGEINTNGHNVTLNAQVSAIKFANAITINGNVTLQGRINAASILVSGELTLAGTHEIGTLTAVGTKLTMTGDVTITSGLTITTGTAETTNKLNAEKATVSSDFTIKGTATIGTLSQQKGTVTVGATEVTTSLTVGTISVYCGTLDFKGSNVTVTNGIELNVETLPIKLTQTNGTDATFTCPSLTIKVTKANAGNLTVDIQTVPAKVTIEDTSAGSHATCDDLKSQVTLAGKPIEHSYSEGTCKYCGADEPKEEATWTLVKNAKDLEDGDQLILAYAPTGGKLKVMSGNIGANTSGKIGISETTIDSSTTQFSNKPADAWVITLGVSNGKYTLLYNDDYYIAYSSKTNINKVTKPTGNAELTDTGAFWTFESEKLYFVSAKDSTRGFAYHISNVVSGKTEPYNVFGAFTKTNITSTTGNDKYAIPAIYRLSSGTDVGGGGGDVEPGGGDTPEEKYGTADAPISVADALKIAADECKNDKNETKQPVVAKGVVVSIGETGGYYKNVTIRDESDVNKTILIYTLNMTDSVDNPDVNDTITIEGYIKNHSGTIEFATNSSNVYVYMRANTRGESSVTVGDVGGATVSGITGNKVKNGEEVTFEVTPPDGKKVVDVKVNGTKITAESDGKTYKFVVHGDTVITVTTADEGAEPETPLVAKYTFTNTKDSKGNSNYTGSYEKDFSGIKWHVEANVTLNPWRFGFKDAGSGKRSLYTMTAMNYDVKKIEITFGTSTLTVNSASLIVSKDSGFSNADTVSFDFKADSTVTIEISQGKDWNNSYFKFLFDVEATGKQYFTITKVVFYAP